MEEFLGFVVGIGIALFLAVIFIMYFLYRRRIGLTHRYDIVSHELDGIFSFSIPISPFLFFRRGN
jgi:O-antigen/teichoic acid export membrane protein